MKRTIKKQFWFNKREAQELEKKAKKACLTEAALVRLLVRGYEPREKPDDRFYAFTRELSGISTNLNQIAMRANSLDFVDVSLLQSSLEELHKFQADLEERFIGNEEGE